jgi:hypothetical protein
MEKKLASKKYLCMKANNMYSAPVTVCGPKYEEPHLPITESCFTAPNAYLNVVCVNKQENFLF